MKHNHKRRKRKSDSLATACTKHHVPALATRSREVLDQAISDGKLFERSTAFRADSLNEEERTVDIVFSAGAEYKQWWGREKLVVSRDACKLDRLNAPYSAFLLNHDTNKQIGTVVSTRIENGEALATVRFSRSALGEEIWQDVKDKIRGQFSTGYRILKYEIDESNERDPLYTITEWEPFEISIVPFAADKRSLAKRVDYLQPLTEPPTEVETRESEGPDLRVEKENTDMDPKELLRIAREANLPEFGMRAIEEEWTLEQLNEAIRAEQEKTTPTPNSDTTPTPESGERSDTDADPPPDGAERSGDPPPGDDPTNALSNDSANEKDKNRVTRIYDLGKEHDARDMAIEAIADPNCSIEEFQKRILAKNKETKQRAEAEHNIPERITLDPKDQRNFRISHLVSYLANNRSGIRGGKEYEICQEESQLREKQGLQTQGIPIPHQIFDQRSVGLTDQAYRLLTAGTDTAGGHTVDDELLADSFIDILLEFTAATRLVTRLDDLQGNLIFPRQDSRAVAQFVGETAAATEQDPTFDTVTMSPKHVRAWTRASTTLIHQSSISIEQFLRKDLGRAAAKVIDKAILTGTGSGNQPKGIEGLGSDRLSQTYPSGGLDYDSVLGCEEKLADKDALMGRLGWVVSPKMRKAGRKTAELGSGTSRPIWRNNKMIDYEAYVTTQVENTDVSGKGYFANWSEMILGFWGGIDVIVNKFAGDTEGWVRISVGQMMDLGARHVESFCEFKIA